MEKQTHVAMKKVWDSDMQQVRSHGAQDTRTFEQWLGVGGDFYEASTTQWPQPLPSTWWVLAYSRHLSGSLESSTERRSGQIRERQVRTWWTPVHVKIMGFNLGEMKYFK